MSAPEHVQGTPVLDGNESNESERMLPAPAPQPAPSLFRTDDPVEVVQKATEVAKALADVIERQRLFAVIQGRKHVRVEGWQLLGSMLGVTAVCVATEHVDNGWIATVEARTADGRVIGRADALCSKDERLWKTRDEYAVLSMAQTRATSKALKGPLGFVISLAGYQTTPAEEMPFEPPVQKQAPQQQRRSEPGPELDGDTHKALVAAIRQAKVDGDWVRWHLIGVGLQDVPEKVTPSVLKRLSLKQANEFLFELSAEVDRRNETDGN